MPAARTRNRDRRSTGPCRPAIPPAVVGLLLAAILAGAPASAQEELEEVFKDIGTATAAEGEESLPARSGEGTVRGQVFDGATGVPVAGATVILARPAPEGGGEPVQEVRVTDGAGGYEFPSVAPARYTVSFVRSGYRASRMTDFEVVADQVNRADFPLPPLPTEASGEVLDLEAFVVEASTVGEMMTSLELRMDSDAVLNVMSAEDLSRFAASDVADALKRVAGVNIVEGQFAIIRGLEDRYSSTLWNGAVVPSPDPDRQSVQLDLFPSDVVDNLVVTKTFTPRAPSNSAGGSIDIVSIEYPDRFEVKLNAGTGFEENARDRFLALNGGSPTGSQADEDDVIESDVGGSIGGRFEWLGRELRLKGVLNQEIDYRTKDGFQQSLEPRQRNLPGENVPGLGQIIQPSGLALGLLELTDGRFDRTESERTEQKTGYGAFGFDLDSAGNHRIDTSYLFTDKAEEKLELLENGWIPGFDYGRLLDTITEGESLDEEEFQNFATNSSWIANGTRQLLAGSPLNGHPFTASFMESTSVDRDRDLRVGQLNGDHEFGFLEGLKLRWAANRAKTTQNEEAYRSRIFYTGTRLPTDVSEFPISVEDLGLGGTYFGRDDLTFNQVEVEEEQGFGRLDLEYGFDPLDFLRMELRGGAWYEKSTREADSSFLEFPVANLGACGAVVCQANFSNFVVLGKTLEEVGRHVGETLQRGDDGRFLGLRDSESDAERRIQAWNLDLKATLWDRLDLLAGARLEKIEIESENVPEEGPEQFGVPDIFPSRYVFFDRLDNPDSPREEYSTLLPPDPDRVFNDQRIGISVPIDPETGLVDIGPEDYAELLRGEIDERKLLPTIGLTYRPIEGLSLRGSYSQTVARPSFREIGYYVTVSEASSDLELGNPKLQLSEVESWDARLEYVYGDGDLFALSVFYKEIEDPIERIVLRDEANFDDVSRALFRTWRNNPNQATLSGFEVEARKSLGFLDPLFGTEFLDYFSIGGNYTYIDAEVDRVAFDLQDAEGVLGTFDGELPRFSGLEGARRLFGQPEWIANADFSFDHPGWGTQMTLAWFGISDVLDAAGSGSRAPNGVVNAFTLDEYVKGFDQLDFVWSQNIWRGLKLKFSAKNLTDSSRGIIYDPDQTAGTIDKRSVRMGRDYSFSLSYTHTFGPGE